MTEKHWQNAYELYSAAVDLPADQRSVFLAASGASSAVIKEVRLLLQDLEGGEAPADPPERPVLEPGTKIGRNVLKDLIGKGGMSRVYSAWDPEAGRDVAVKLIDPRMVAAVGVEKATREARAASALNHPNIITVHEVIPHELGMAIVMELVDGLALRSIIGRPHPLEELAAIGAQAALALDAAHMQGIVHRDVKPENIMLRRDGRVKILDFGLAGRLSRSGFNYQSAILSGTLRYMSPEQGTDNKLTAATDVYSLGLVLYELATGRHAFPGETPFDTMQAIASQDAPPPSRHAPDLPPEFDALMKAMLQRSPGLRPTARKVAETLNGMRGANRAVRPARARNWLPVAAGLALVAAAVSFALFSRLPKRAEPTLRQITSNAAEDRIDAAAISPDGRRLAYAGSAGLAVRKLPSKETAAYRLPPNFRATRLAWSANGDELVISGFSAIGRSPAVWLFPLNVSQPRLLREDASHAAVSPDGARIAFASAKESEIWVCGASGQSPVKVIGGGNDTFPVLLWSPGGKLAYLRRYFDRAAAVQQTAYETFDVDSAKVLSRYSGINLQSAAYLTPSRLVMLRFNPPPDADQSNLWEADTDPVTGGIRGAARQLSHFQAGVYEGLTAPREATLVSLTAALRGSRAEASNVYLVDLR